MMILQVKKIRKLWLALQGEGYSAEGHKTFLIKSKKEQKD